MSRSVALTVTPVMLLTFTFRALLVTYTASIAEVEPANPYSAVGTVLLTPAP